MYLSTITLLYRIIFLSPNSPLFHLFILHILQLFYDYLTVLGIFFIVFVFSLGFPINSIISSANKVFFSNLYTFYFWHLAKIFSKMLNGNRGREGDIFALFTVFGEGVSFLTIKPDVNYTFLSF
jgi:hypothetical protein